MKRIIAFFLIAIPLWSIAQQQETKTPITVTELGQGVHRLFVNNAVSVVSFSGDDGLLIIDTGYERTVNDLSEKLKEVSDKPLKYIINTHIHGDHTGGNVALGKGVDIIAHQNVKDYLSKEKKQGDRVIPAFPEFAQPNISFTEKMSLNFNDETLQLLHLPEGHTSGDIIIYFPKRKILVVGDLLFANYFPYVDVGNGGNPIKFLANVDWITKNFPADVTVVGGHGPIYTIEEYKNYHKTLMATIEVLRTHKQKGMTAEQMKEGKVLKEWASYGSFFITEDRWIDTLFPFM
ncbi:MAG: MBL fold metallo-hydrolase [Tenuifilaceae bacterium]|jgi:glyoxylase-like metal-dependent hydrolase (beta-lactamase superfamily II)|nr:MBL fold metallo-hydrolase [Tenuifilaceae bacterium]